MNTLIIDDEKAAISILTNFVERIPFLQLQLATRDAFKGLELLQHHNIDLLFLDIEMPDMTGIQLLKSLEKKPLVVFTTAYENYALEGYELDVLDYLVKPIRFERFLKAVNKAQKMHVLNSGGVLPVVEDGFLTITVEYRTIKIRYDDIVYIEGLKDYIKVHTTTKMYVTRLNLKSVMDKLPGELFLRVHRSFIISLKRVTSFQKGMVYLGDISIPIGVSYQERVGLRLK